MSATGKTAAINSSESPVRPFVPLNLHTHYSLLDGATQIEDLIEIARASNMPLAANAPQVKRGW